MDWAGYIYIFVCTYVGMYTTINEKGAMKLKVCRKIRRERKGKMMWLYSQKYKTEEMLIRLE